MPLLEYGSQNKVPLQSLVKEVKVTGDEVLLAYTVPLSPRRVSEEKAGVLPTVQYGGLYLTVPELLFDKKQLIPALQQLLTSCSSIPYGVEDIHSPS